jgi:hypothetical protein
MVNMNPRVFSVACILSVCVVGTAHAQQRPLVTEDPESIGSRRVLVEGGFETAWDQFFPASGIDGDVVRGPSLGVSVGISPTAEVQVDWGVFQRVAVTRLEPAPFSETLSLSSGRGVSVEDMLVATKIRLLAEGTSVPAVGVRFGTKLPTADRQEGIGLQTTDFFATLLVAKTIRSVRTVGNAGLLILGNPLPGDTPVPALGLGVSVARAITNAFEVVGEINGRLDAWRDPVPIGTESRSSFRLGARYTYNLLRVDAGLTIGMTPRDPGVGLTLGATYVIAR